MFRKVREIKRTASFGGILAQTETPKSKTLSIKLKKNRSKKRKSRNKKSAFKKKWSTQHQPSTGFWISRN
jgi:hypothetical protein